MKTPKKWKYLPRRSNFEKTRQRAAFLDETGTIIFTVSANFNEDVGEIADSILYALTPHPPSKPEEELK